MINLWVNIQVLVLSFRETASQISELLLSCLVKVFDMLTIYRVIKCILTVLLEHWPVKSPSNVPQADFLLFAYSNLFKIWVVGLWTLVIAVSIVV